MDEKKLVKNIIAGNKKAIRLFYKTHKSRLFKHILKKVSNKKDAEEILQDVFMSALDSLPVFRFDSSLYTWVQTIARHEIADFYRKKKIKTLVFSRFPFIKKIVSQALSPELALQEKEIKQKIMATFKSISEGYSQILRLKYIEGKSYLEIAEILNKSPKAVESQLSRARLAFQKEYNWQTKNLNVKTKDFNKKDWEILLTSFS
jgi:RNA polymerase sigma-70 factor, ECF subfamily